MNDVVHAMDADSVNGANAGVVWRRDFRNPSADVTPILISDIVGSSTLKIVGNVGIESTPQVDLSPSTMYLVARIKEVSGSTTNYVARLDALDLATGNGNFGGPVVIQGAVAGNGVGSSGGTLTFDPLIHNQRSSVALVNGMILFAWASHEDLFAWYGWIMAYNAQTLRQVAIFCIAPNGAGGGSWMAGRAPAVDSNGNVYYMTGNGDEDGSTNFGDSILKSSSSSGGLSLVDYFISYDYATLQTNDRDLGSSGPLLVPGTDLVMGAGKNSVFYVMRVSNMGHEQSGNNQIVQGFLTNGNDIRGGQVFWQRTTGAGPTMYVWPHSIGFQAYHFNGSTFDTPAMSQSTINGVNGNSGGVLTLSDNGGTPGTGIVWSSMPLSDDADYGVHQGVLRAFDANDLANELWDSTMNSSRDDPGLWPKYSRPLVVNGNVYLASFSNVLNVYGLLSSMPDFTISSSPASASVSLGGSTSYTVSVGALNEFNSFSEPECKRSAHGSYGYVQPHVDNTGEQYHADGEDDVERPGGELTITESSGSLTYSATVTLTVTTGSGSTGKIISIDFVGTGMGASEVAGVVAKSNWNNASGASSSAAMGLVDETGTATTGDGELEVGQRVVAADHGSTGDARMKEGYLDTGSGNTTTVTVSSLAAYRMGPTVRQVARGCIRSAGRGSPRRASV
jgi:hypothetical protein